MIDPVNFFKLLAEQQRLQLTMLIIRQGELCVCELTGATGLIQPTVSRHLNILRKAGLLLARRQGQWVFYRLNPQLPDWITLVLQQTAQANAPLITPLLHNLQQMPERPGRCN
ncbi:metalloregulator ArsR/SmtB family transcription factor [Arsukibacterium sp.]|uniref:metalloregulator ArsR/SmtB family transcription factor n=1 Tax=Arsukibacterium sp. TaxID=1977258 RepID=UPI001BD3BFB3